MHDRGVVLGGEDGRDGVGAQGEVLHDAVEAAKADPPVGLQAEPAPSAAQSKTAESVGGLEAPVDTETLAKLHDPVRANEAADGRRVL